MIQLTQARYDELLAAEAKLCIPIAGELPCWEEISAKNERGETLTALELFIYDNEPAGDADMWRDQLADALASAPVAGEAKNYPGENVAERLDNMADDQPPGSQAQSDLYAAATIWRKHIAHRAAPQALKD